MDVARKKLRVAACQLHDAGEDIEANARKVVEQLAACAARKVDVAAFSEGFLYGYTGRPGFWEDLDPKRLAAAERTIIDACKRHRVAAVVGSAHDENGERYNSLLIVDRDGTTPGRYGKIQLAGEKWCASGTVLPVYSLAGVPSCFIICHDVRYPELVRLPAAAGAKVCFFCSCESSLAEEWKLSAYRAMPISRATENGIYVVMANAPADPRDIKRAGSSHGQSKIIHPDGNVVEEAGYLSEEVLVADLDLARATGGIARQSVENATPVQSWMAEGVDLVVRT